MDQEGRNVNTWWLSACSAVSLLDGSGCNRALTKSFAGVELECTEMRL